MNEAENNILFAFKENHLDNQLYIFSLTLWRHENKMRVLIYMDIIGLEML